MTSRQSAPSKPRQATSSSALVVKPQCKIHPTATVADKAQIVGANTVELGENSFIHPHARIRAEFGNVTIARGVIISETAVVGASEESTGDVVIGNGVSIESGARVEAKSIADHTTIEVNAKVGKGAVVGSWCKITPMCVVAEFEVLEDFTVVFGDGKRRIDTTVRDRQDVRDMKIKGRESEIELLKTLIPDSSAKWTTV